MIKPQMTLRYLWKNRWEVALAIITLVFLYLWTSGSHNDLYPYDYDSSVPCDPTCDSSQCVRCRPNVRVSVKDVDVADVLKLRKAIRRATSAAGDSKLNTSSQLVCKRPNFDLKHDSVSYAFFHMRKLNCSNEELFYKDRHVIRFRRSVLGQRVIKECVYYGIERATDDYAGYTEPLKKEGEPFDIILKHDFVRIKCYMQKNDSSDENNDVDSQNNFQDKKNYNDNKKLNESNTSKKRKQETADGKGKSVDNIIENVNSSIVDNTNEHGETNDDVRRQFEEVQYQVEGNYNDYDPFQTYDSEVAEPDFDQLIAQIVPRQDVHTRIKMVAPVTDFQKRPNVLMLGLDSMSHLSWQRKLPKTYRLEY